MRRRTLVEDAPGGARVRTPDPRVPPTVLDGPLEGVLAALLLLHVTGDDAWAEPDDAPGVAGRRARAEAAVDLVRAVAALRPDEPEARALLALVLLRHARRGARTGPDGRPLDLEDQDRSLWRRDEIDEGRRVLERALADGRPGPYLVAAAIEALHDDAPTAAATEWDEILALHDALAGLATGRATGWPPSPLAALERAVARGMVHGLEVGLVALDELEGMPGLEGLLPAARARLHRSAPR
ncbi:DUF6596 domain-containing protein [Isoptericola variabilis]|uniref:Putative ECF subfamily RNA polymerase sigma-24 subunit n=1 Tax=Isoptericola variabilis (strain 225) TaxID=743718 RepID=F6FSL5_ISOV2|nr:DUF6596 domain-containing protein [Isoptericola variabilis]AEG45177.1 putative ECF subfamily RNA polymerase sigma-24 subunit [Isoptericola variabilis 225]TWH34008.1 RNA polymerase sigma-70 factor (ECF subfamily) [Isoptericola variabilis J7]